MSTTVAAEADLLRDVLPPDRIVTGDDIRKWAVVGRPPRMVAYPDSPEEVASLLGLAREERWAVEPAGAGGWLGAGNPGRPVDLVVSTARMDQVVEHEPGDLTLTAAAGLPLRTLAQRARDARQWLAADPPGTRGTLGGLVSTGSTGPLQAGYGGPRDLVLGLEMVSGDGRVLHLGGRVVKNVAGFDLVRLVVGSRGTLGIVTAVTVRLHPLPPVDQTWVLDAERAEDLVSVARRMAGTDVNPAALEVVERRGPHPDGAPPPARLAARLLGPAERVQAEAETLGRAAGRPLSPLEDEEALDFWDGLRAMENGADLVVRMALPPEEASDLLRIAGALGRVRGGRDELARAAVRSALHVASGILRVAVPNVRTDTGWDEKWAERLMDLRRTLEVRGGSLVVSEGPRQIVERVGAWGHPGPAARLMREIKARFDPGGILSPGRFVIPDEGGGRDGGEGDDVPSTNEDT